MSSTSSAVIEEGVHLKGAMLVACFVAAGIAQNR
jgi:hypothetical protein